MSALLCSTNGEYGTPLFAEHLPVAGTVVFSQRYERGSILVTTNLPFDEWTEVFGSERLTGALLDRLTHRVHILEINGESYRLRQSRMGAARHSTGDPADA